MKAALLLYATLALLLLFILVMGIMLVVAAPEDEADAAVSRARRKDARAQRRTAGPLSLRMRLLLVVGIVVVLLGVWVAAGFTTSDPGLCTSCHGSAQHAKAAKGADPHVRVGCVSCHEPGGVIGRYVTGVPFRLLHLAMASEGAGNEVGYGRVTTRACTPCHTASLSGTTTNTERGLKMSHAEPLAASATCVDCHTIRNGVVGVYNEGMKPCLRCHDADKVSAACTTCHVGQIAAAASAETTSYRSVQIREVSCAGCHNEKRDCDPCHGLRMPHTAAFKTHVHARAAAVDLWYNGGKACGRCHTASSRPCGKCHSAMMGRAHGTTGSIAPIHRRASSASCNTCHQEYAYIATRDFCKDVCHSQAAIAASPR